MTTNAVALSGWDAEFNGLVLDTEIKGKLVSNQKSVTVYGAAYRDNGVMVMPGALSTSSGDDVFLTWSPNGNSLHARFFALLIPSGGTSTAIDVVGEGFDAMAFTTNHSYLSSTVVKDGVPYFTRMHFDPVKKSITYTTATNNYDTQGGTVIQTKTIAYNTTSKYDTALWESYKNNSLGFGFGVFDNYAGTSASVTLSEVSYSGTGSTLLPSFNDTVKSFGGYYSTFATLSKAAYHLASIETVGNGNNTVKPYSEISWNAINSKWKVLTANDIAWAPPTSNDGINGFSTSLMSRDGIYIASNAAAFAARVNDALVISIRGTNDNDASASPPTPDMKDWASMSEHYAKLKPFLDKIDEYVTKEGISKVYVTGHSLGGAMVQAYMKYHPNGAVNYEAVTFASAGYDFVASEAAVNADRIVSIENVGDPVPMTGDQYGHVIGVNLAGLKHLEGSNSGNAYNLADFHSMDLYAAVASTLDKQLPNTSEAVSSTMLHGFEKSSFNSSLQAEIYLGAYETSRAWNDPSYEKYVWEGAPSTFAPKYQTLSGNDFFEVYSLPSRQSKTALFLGGDGVDTVRFSHPSSGWSINAVNKKITLSYSGQSYYELKDVERISFFDKNIAFDTSGSSNAGKVAKILASVFGVSALSNKDYAKIGLSLIDSGLTYEALSALAIKAAGANTREAVVDLLWTNLMGSHPTTEQARPFVETLSPDLSNVGTLGANAADFAATIGVVNLSALGQNGFEYF